MTFHITKDGREIKIKDLEDKHLSNIIKWIDKKALYGVTVRKSLYNEDEVIRVEKKIYGEEVRDKYNYNKYVKEARGRGLLRTLKELLIEVN